MQVIKHIVIHWTASGSNTTMSQLRDWHVKGHGWRDIAYHRVILHPQAVKDAEDWYQLVKAGRPINDDHFLSEAEKGAHAFGLNHNSVGLCVVGMPGLPLHPLQKEALIQTVRILTKRFGVAPKDVIGHRDVFKLTNGKGTATACPGDEIYKIVKEIQSGRHL